MAAFAGGRSPIRAVAMAYVLIGTPLAGALLAWWGRAYWSYSDGVYLLTARMLDAGLYSDVLAAQPPPLFWFGAAVLAIADSVVAVRGALALLALATGWLVALCVWRLTASRAGAAVAGVAALATPWRLHESLTLTPESLAAPLLLAAALLGAGSPRRGAIGGVAAGLAACTKVAFALPAAALALGVAARVRFAASATLTAVALAALSLVLYGGALIENVLTAQAQTGVRGIAVVAPLFVQAAWNLGPLLVPAALAWRLRARLRDAALLRALGALLLGELALLPTVFKQGTSLNLIAVVEPAAVALAASAVTLLVAEATGRPGDRRPRADQPRATGRGRRARHLFKPRRLALAAVAACGTLVVAQSLSLVLSPADPGLFARPLSDLAYERQLSGAQVDAAVQRARGCPPGAPYSGPPYLAFVAKRPPPGGQPDGFILQRAETHAEQRAAAAADGPRCP